MVTARPGPDGKPQVSIHYQVHIWDRYNWDPGKSTPIAGTDIKDSDMAALHQTGLAREYDLIGRSTPRTVALPESSADLPAVPDWPSGTRDGTRSDPGREDR